MTATSSRQHAGPRSRQPRYTTIRDVTRWGDVLHRLPRICCNPSGRGADGSTVVRMRRRAGVRMAVLAVLVLVAGAQSTAAPLPDRVEFTAVGDFSSSSQAASVMTAIKDSGSVSPWRSATFRTAPPGRSRPGATSSPPSGRGVSVRAVVREPREQRPERQHQRLLGLPAEPAARCGRHLRSAVLRRRATVSPLVRFIHDLARTTFPDSTWSYAAGTPRYNWTAAAIDGARAAGIPWVVVGMHKPCLTSGSTPVSLAPTSQPAVQQEGRPGAFRSRAQLPAHQPARDSDRAVLPSHLGLQRRLRGRQRLDVQFWGGHRVRRSWVPVASPFATTTRPTPRPVMWPLVPARTRTRPGVA